MSKDIAQSGASGDDTPLLSELFQRDVYKPTQGRIVRQLTALAVWVVVALGSWRLFGMLPSMMGDASVAGRAIPAVILAVGLWFGFRLVNWPRFADFLIAVEAEMNKVTWPSKDELIRASVVVIFTIFALAVTLFLFDVIWQFIFSTLGVTT
ncbi:MAG: preprotein translocase subunit SecE [Planctomycetota bacterium]